MPSKLVFAVAQKFNLSGADEIMAIAGIVDGRAKCGSIKVTVERPLGALLVGLLDVDQVHTFAPGAPVQETLPVEIRPARVGDNEYRTD